MEIVDFLQEKTLYSLLPLSSKIILVDVGLSIGDAAEIMRESGIDVLVLWHPEGARVGTTFELADLTDLVLAYFLIPTLSKGAMLLEEPISPPKMMARKNSTDEDENFERFVLPVLPLLRDGRASELTEAKRDPSQLESLLSHVSVRLWSARVAPMNLHGKAVIGQNLKGVLADMTSRGLGRIIVHDEDAAMPVGCISPADALLFVAINLRLTSDALLNGKGILGDASVRSGFAAFEGQTLLEALICMRAARKTFIPIVNAERRPVGLLTLKPVLEIFLAGRFEQLGTPCGGNLPPVAFYSPEDSLKETVDKLLSAEAHMLVQVDSEGRYAGFVEADDVFRCCFHVSEG